VPSRGSCLEPYGGTMLMYWFYSRCTLLFQSLCSFISKPSMGFWAYFRFTDWLLGFTHNCLARLALGFSVIPRMFSPDWLLVFWAPQLYCALCLETVARCVCTQGRLLLLWSCRACLFSHPPFPFWFLSVGSWPVSAM
jgi:hypothetical protein